MCYQSISLFVFFFFFQAEDGIRDYKVTGVQTCALPISWGRYSVPLDFLCVICRAQAREPPAMLHIWAAVGLVKKLRYDGAFEGGSRCGEPASRPRWK